MATHVDPQYLESLETPQQIDNSSAWKDIFAGTVGGIAQVLSGQPFDTTKVRLQSAPEGTYNGAMDVVKQLMKNEGVAGFYKGTLTPLIGVGACVSVQFAVNEGMKRYFDSRNGTHTTSLSYSQLYISGAMAGFMNTFLASPIEQIRIRLQTQTADSAVKLNGPIDAIRQVIKYGGIGNGLFRGFVPCLIREVHGMGIYFLAAEACIKYEMEHFHKLRTEVPSWHVCLYGGVAGIAMWVTSYPIDVIKSRYQTDAMIPKDRKYTSMWQCYKVTTAKGTSAIFRGFTPTILRAVPVNAVTFLAFDYTRRLLGP